MKKTLLISAALLGSLILTDLTYANSPSHTQVLTLKSASLSNVPITVTYQIAYRNQLSTPTHYTRQATTTLVPGELWHISVPMNPHYRHAGIELKQFTVSGHRISSSDFPHDFAAPGEAAGCSYAFDQHPGETPTLRLMVEKTAHKISVVCSANNH